ncbi:3-oxo-tetronate kinase [Ancylobacter mangrovi]|uniref:3-oxo-tetronate kinase n=1 Tax=Ancylobacter mangrovi TaxID=2972472 RepID=UPI002162AF73|nr:3-oxo-tetronate kinase [Ancylobacter mangrovi]MCS0502038.1 four-carbon acid sugar kinase family protein [Ancylobacter mangrovi]
MLLGCIADDFTGASDLANTLAKGGMRTTQFVGIPEGDGRLDCEAGVVALKSRSIAPAEAVRQSLDALEWLRGQGCTQILFKYCSTFDSTPQGNIGPVAESLLDALDAPVAVVCPAFPLAGRMIFAGHLFVGGRLLNESGMQNHPLTPMTDADLCRWLRHQTRGEVGLVPFDVVRRGSEPIRAALDAQAAAGNRLVVVDALGDEDLMAIGAAIAGHRLVTGGSGIALGLPENFRRQGLLAAAAPQQARATGPGVALSGSCSVATREQVAVHLHAHPGLRVEAEALISSRITVADALAFVSEHLDQSPLIYSTADPDKVAAAQSRYGREAVAQSFEVFFADLARSLPALGVARLAVGGGETAGAVVTALGISQLRVGGEIDPGVPALVANGRTPLHLALKSGNFGGRDFYDRALRALEAV